jgi:tRNA(Arg) A34 adenosine deaminase TadA
LWAGELAASWRKDAGLLLHGAAAISFARIRRLYFGAADAKGGAVEHGPRLFGQATCHHAPEVVSGLGETKAAALLKEFFAQRR